MSKENSYRSDLPLSKRSRMPYEDLLNMNQIYCNNLKKYSENCKELRKLLSKDDMNVIDDLLKENYTYITLLAKDPLNRIEFRNLCEISLKILNIIQQFKMQKDILLYEKMQRIKFYEIRCASLLNFSSEEDLCQLDTLLNELEELERDPEVIQHLSLIKVANRVLYKAMIKFEQGAIESCEEIALSALDILENDKDSKEDVKRVMKMSQILLFLSEIYDFKNDTQSALSCYERAYYLNLGKFGQENEETKRVKALKDNYNSSLMNKNKKEQSQKELNDDNNVNYYYDSFQENKSINESKESNNQNNNFNQRKLINGTCKSCFGSTDTFSFKIPYTKIFEPMNIFIYAKNRDENEDRFSPRLYLNNLFFDKKSLFRHLGIKGQKQENYLLYTDEVLNVILEEIEVNESEIYLNGDIVKNSLIKY